MSRFRLALLIVGSSLLVLFAGSFAVGNALEESNAFCASCHVHNLQYGRFTGKKVTDLASEHAEEKVKCISCHREPGSGGRLYTFYRASRALGHYVIGDYKMPIETDAPPSDRACRKCHGPKTKGETRLDGHFHSATNLAKASSRIKGASVGCATCHEAHDPPTKVTHWVAVDSANPACNRCHDALGEGDRATVNPDGTLPPEESDE